MYIYIYIYIYILGALTLEQRVVRLFASCGVWWARCPQAQCRESTRTKMDRKINAKSSPNRRQIDHKSTKNRSWAVQGDPGRCGDAPGRRRNAPGTRKSAPGTAKSALGVAPGHPRALQERSGHPQNAFRKLPGRPLKVCAVPHADESARGSKF